MIWVMIFLLALAVFLLTVFGLKAPRSGWEAIGAALFLGIAGYSLQASTGLSGAPKVAEQSMVTDPAAIVEERGRLAKRGILPSNQWIIVADAMVRNGQFANAAQILLGAVEDDPKNSEVWLAMANALVAHSEGRLTPASLYAFRKAEESGPDDPGVPFFLGMALAQSGRFADAKALWTDLLAKSEADAPWRDLLETRLLRLETLIDAQAGTAAGTR